MWHFITEHTFSEKEKFGNKWRRKQLQYLKNCESEGVSQVIWRLQYFLPIVAIQVNATEHVQLRVNPVQSALDQIWEEEVHGQTKENNKWKNNNYIRYDWKKWRTMNKSVLDKGNEISELNRKEGWKDQE